MSADDSILVCDAVTRSYGKGPTHQTVLDGISLDFARGESVALVGPSGSGKTTLLTILGCLLSPSSGSLRVDGQEIDHGRKAMLNHVRSRIMGFVFQHAQLLPFLDVWDNLKVVGRNAGLGRSSLSNRITEVLEALDIAGLRRKMPNQVSGGERQRVAIARAVLHQPSIILADEPTASLDWQNGLAVVKMLVRQAKEQGALLITVTHDTRLLDLFDRILSIDQGKVTET